MTSNISRPKVLEDITYILENHKQILAEKYIERLGRPGAPVGSSKKHTFILEDGTPVSSLHLDTHHYHLQPIHEPLKGMVDQSALFSSGSDSAVDSFDVVFEMSSGQIKSQSSKDSLTKLLLNTVALSQGYAVYCHLVLHRKNESSSSSQLEERVVLLVPDTCALVARVRSKNEMATLAPERNSHIRISRDMRRFQPQQQQKHSKWYEEALRSSTVSSGIQKQRHMKEDLLSSSSPSSSSDNGIVVNWKQVGLSKIKEEDKASSNDLDGDTVMRDSVSSSAIDACIPVDNLAKWVLHDIVSQYDMYAINRYMIIPKKSITEQVSSDQLMVVTKSDEPAVALIEAPPAASVETPDVHQTTPLVTETLNSAASTTKRKGKQQNAVAAASVADDGDNIDETEEIAAPPARPKSASSSTKKPSSKKQATVATNEDI